MSSDFKKNNDSFNHSSKKRFMVLQILYLFVGFLTVLEYIFIRGMFTWLIAVVTVVVIGALNIIVSIKNKNLLLAALYILTTISLCMGYFMYA